MQQLMPNDLAKRLAFCEEVLGIMERDEGLSKRIIFARFEVFTVVTMKNGVFWDVTPCGSCKNRRSGGT
jgi:hypothetical protein